jgi:hypothetical protein
MAAIATSSIARGAFIDPTGQHVQILSQYSLLAKPVAGDESTMGQTISTFTLASIAGAAIYNPSKLYEGNVPIEGQVSTTSRTSLFLILAAICGTHLAMLIVVAVLRRVVQAGPTSNIDMAILLRPIAETLESVSGGRNNKSFRDAKKGTQARYVKARNGRWVVSVT